ncbi:MAG: hypothetical protein HY951_06415 [Bacteroidia bacterium]|nr:hypothetical protein [Bacteroidia bacterium]
MINLNYTWISINCPKCSYEFDIQLIDAKSEKNVYCHNCKLTIRLQDSEASVHTGIDSVNNAMKEVENIFKNFGK